MKKLFIFLFIALVTVIQLQAQAPQGFNYQATVRNSAGDLIVNTNVYFKFNVIQGSQTAVPIFIETHYVATDDLGHVNLVMGEGTPQNNLANFNEINWALGSYYLGIEIDTGNGYVAMGTTQLLSVPYALYAENSGNAAANSTLASVLSTNNSAGQQQIKNLLDPTDPADAVTKSYVDALSINTGLMNFNDWDNYQVWDDNTTLQLEPNSFVYVNANQTILVFPQTADNFGDVIYVYVMQGDNNTPRDFVLQPSGSNVAIHAGTDLESTATEQIHGQFQTGGLQTIVNVGDYWMVGNFNGVFNSPTEDDDNDGFTEEQGDCDDSDADIFPGQNWYIDADGDGYASTSIVACARPVNGRLPSELSGNIIQIDCDDTNANISPGRYEIGHDGLDNNCDGEIDGFAGIYTVTESAYWRLGAGGSDWNGNLVLIESVGGNIYRHVGLAYWDDNEYYFTVDSNTNVITVLDVDLEGNGVNLNGQPIMTCESNNGFTVLACDASSSLAVPDDVAGADQLIMTVGYLTAGSGPREFHEVLKRGNLATTSDNDGDGYSIISGDCNDNDPNINPGATEILFDGIDNNCSGMDGDGFTERDLGVSMSWAASSKVTDNYGNEIGAYDLANLRLLLTDSPYTTVIDSADGAGAETYVLSGDAPDGEYSFVADFYAAMDIPADLDITLTFGQIGVINSQKHTFTKGLSTEFICNNNYLVMAKVTKVGTSYAFEEIAQNGSAPSIAGTYDVVSNGLSSDSGPVNNPLVDFASTVVITDNGDGTYTFSDGWAGVYVDWYTMYGYTTLEEQIITLTPCLDLSASWTDAFGVGNLLSGVVNSDGTLSIRLDNDWGDYVDAVYTIR